MRLHYLPGTAAMAPHATLAEIGVPYELVRVERDQDGRHSDAYLALKLSSSGTTTGSTGTLQVRRGPAAANGVRQQELPPPEFATA